MARVVFKNKYLLITKTMLIFTKKYDTISLKHKGVCDMSMKVTKKILAGTLALMSSFSAVSAEPVGIEESPNVSTSVNNEEAEAKVKAKTEAEAKLVRDAAMVGSTIGAAGVVIAAFVGEALGKLTAFYTNNKDLRENYSMSFHNNLCHVLQWFIIASNIPEFGEVIEKYGKTYQNKEEKEEVLNLLFKILNGNKKGNGVNILADNLKYIDDLRDGRNDFGQRIIRESNEYCKNVKSICGVFSCDGPSKGMVRRTIDSSNRGPFGWLKQIEVSSSNGSPNRYELKAMIVEGNETRLYMRTSEGGWCEILFNGTSRKVKNMNRVNKSTFQGECIRHLYYKLV